MSANRHSKLVRLDARLEKLHKEHPAVFNLVAVLLGVLLGTVALLIEWVLR
jgi:hypothetical protein